MSSTEQVPRPSSATARGVRPASAVGGAVGVGPVTATDPGGLHAAQGTGRCRDAETGLTGPRRCRKSSPLLAAVALWAGLAADVTAQGSAATDRAALEALYDATGGPGWTEDTNWTTAAPLGEWFGVTADADGRVTRLELPGNGLTGLMPDALGDLARLQELYLQGRWDSTSQRFFSNALTVPISRAMGRLTALRRLHLRSNELTGPIPVELGDLTNLESLDLGWNDLTGPIPRELGSLVNLQSLELSYNELTGPIPRELESLVKLESVHLSGNELTGPILSEIGSLVNLSSLDLRENELTGPILSEIGSLVNLRTVIDIKLSTSSG